MKITSLKLVNFRNYSNLELEFSKHLNVIIGNNGSGKTNIVESIFILALTKSFRTNNDESFFKDDCNNCLIEAKVKDKNTSVYKINFVDKLKKITINKNKIIKIGDYISRINIVLFSVEDLKLIKDNPSIHRKLFNMELSGFDNEYLKDLSFYNKILKQRNTYLKSMMLNSIIPKEYLDVLTDKLVDYNLKIYFKRKKYVENINLYLNDIFYKITGKNGLKINYMSNFKESNKEKLKLEYEKSFKKDLNYGKTNLGVHLDDFIFMFNNKIAKEYLSEGECKNAIISLKLAEIYYYKESLNKDAILILDDLFSELDKDKINNILKYLDGSIQTFITTTDLHKINKNILKDCNVYKIKDGKIKVQKYE